MKNHDERMDSINKKAEAYYKQRAKTRKHIYSAGTTVVSAVLLVLCLTSIPRLIKRVEDGGGQNSQAVTSITSGDSIGKGVTIPALEMPEPKEGVSYSMIGLVVYNGRIYTNAQFLRSDQAALDKLLGEKLGTARGNLNEWSSRTEFDKEFASTIPGDVYAVNGYDTDFRICVPFPYGDGAEGLAFLENLNGITVDSGADLYEKLKMKENYTNVKYQLHEDWDYNKGNYKEYTDISDDQLKEFVNALYNAPFEDLSQEDIYASGKKQTHLFFAMNDGTTVRIRLFENGYVGYEYMYDRVFVHITDDIFTTVFSASTK